jgi:hypothetical protein
MRSTSSSRGRICTDRPAPHPETTILHPLETIHYLRETILRRLETSILLLVKTTQQAETILHPCTTLHPTETTQHQPERIPRASQTTVNLSKTTHQQSVVVQDQTGIHFRTEIVLPLLRTSSQPNVVFLSLARTKWPRFRQTCLLDVITVPCKASLGCACNLPTSPACPPFTTITSTTNYATAPTSTLLKDLMSQNQSGLLSASLLHASFLL